jgi:hypothetical protein
MNATNAGESAYTEHIDDPETALTAPVTILEEWEGTSIERNKIPISKAISLNTYREYPDMLAIRVTARNLVTPESWQVSDIEPPLFDLTDATSEPFDDGGAKLTPSETVRQSSIDFSQLQSLHEDLPRYVEKLTEDSEIPMTYNPRYMTYGYGAGKKDPRKHLKYIQYIWHFGASKQSGDTSVQIGEDTKHEEGEAADANPSN